MSAYPRLVATDEGLSMLAAAAGADTLHITRLALGEGVTADPPEDWQGYTQLIDFKLNAPIVESRHEDGTNYIDVWFTVENTGVEASFVVREIGVYACNNDGVEHLLGYTNGGNECDVCANKDNPESESLRITLYFGNGTSFTAIVDPEGLVNVRQCNKFKGEMQERMDEQEQALQQRLDDALKDLNAKEKAIEAAVNAKMTQVNILVSGMESRVNSAISRLSFGGYQKLTVAAGTTYTAPTDGFLLVDYDSYGRGWTYKISVNGLDVACISSAGSFGNSDHSACIPMRKGDRWKIHFTRGGHKLPPVWWMSARG